MKVTASIGTGFCTKKQKATRLAGIILLVEVRFLFVSKRRSAQLHLRRKKRLRRESKLVASPTVLCTSKLCRYASPGSLAQCLLDMRETSSSFRFCSARERNSIIGNGPQLLLRYVKALSRANIELSNSF